MRDRGFALLAVLWLILALAAAAAAGGVALKAGLRASANRAVLVRGRWGAEACLAIAEQRWVVRRWTETAEMELGRGTRCSWRAEYPSALLNLNLVSRSELEALLRGLRVPDDSAQIWIDSIVAARALAWFTDVLQAADLRGFPPAVLPFLTVD